MKTRQGGEGGKGAASSSPVLAQSQGPRLLQRRDIDIPDEIETPWRASYLDLQKILTGATQQDNSILQAKVAESADSHTDIVTGLLFGILANSSQSENYFRYLSFVVRDGFGLCVLELKRLIMEKYHKMLDPTRRQLLWLIQELVKLKVPEVDTLLAAVLRQIIGGDVSNKNLLLASSILKVLVDNKAWLYGMPRLIPLAFVTFIRLAVGDHNKPPMAAMRQQEIAFCCSLWREKFDECKAVGRDAVRLLQEANKIPEVEAIWKDMMTRPAVFSQEFTGVHDLLAMKTPRKYLITRLTPEMENQILFILKTVKMGNQKRYQGWFMQKFLTTAESESLIPDLIRYICGVYHPPNHVLCSDIVPRWAIIGWLLKCVKTKYMAQNAKLALFYDWLFFDPKVDNIMNIEPAILLMMHSIPKYADITCSLIEFLVVTVESYPEGQRDMVKRGIHNSLHILLSKGVVGSVLPIYNCPSLDPGVRKRLQPLFRPFLKLDEDGEGGFEGQQPPAQQPPLPQQMFPQQPPLQQHLPQPVQHITKPPQQQTPVAQQPGIPQQPVEASAEQDSPEELEIEGGVVDTGRAVREGFEGMQEEPPVSSDDTAIRAPIPAKPSTVVTKVKDVPPLKVDLKPIKRDTPLSPPPSIDVPPSLVFLSRFLGDFVHALRSNEPAAVEAQANILQHLFSNLQKLSSINKYTPRTAPDLASFLHSHLHREFADRIAPNVLFGNRPALHQSLFSSYAACLYKEKQFQQSKPTESARNERNRVIACLLDILAEFKLLEPSLGYRLLAWCVVTAIQTLNKQSQARRPSLKEDELGILGEMMKEDKESGGGEKEGPSEIKDEKGKGKEREDKDKEKEKDDDEQDSMLSIEEGEESNSSFSMEGAFAEGGIVDVDACYRLFPLLPHDVLLPYGALLVHLEGPAKQAPAMHPLVVDCQACLRESTDVFMRLVPFVFRYLPQFVDQCRLDLVHLIVSTADPTHVRIFVGDLVALTFVQLRSLVGKLMLGELEMFGAHAPALLAKTLEWESLDQYFLWQLLTAEYSSQHTPQELESLASRLVGVIDPERHVEALTGLLFLLKNVRATPALLKSVLSSPFGRFSTCLLTHWGRRDPQGVCTLLVNEINRMGERASDLENKLDRERERERERKAGRAQRGAEGFLLPKAGPDRRYVECLLRNLELWNRAGRLSAAHNSHRGLRASGSPSGAEAQGGDDVLNRPALKQALSRLMNSWGLKASRYEGLFGSTEWGGTRFSGSSGGGAGPEGKNDGKRGRKAAESAGDGPLKKRMKLRSSSDAEDGPEPRKQKRKHQSDADPDAEAEEEQDIKERKKGEGKEDERGKERAKREAKDPGKPNGEAGENIDREGYYRLIFEDNSDDEGNPSHHRKSPSVSPSASPPFPHAVGRRDSLGSSAPPAFWNSAMKREREGEREMDREASREREREHRDREREKEKERGRDVPRDKDRERETKEQAKLREDEAMAQRKRKVKRIRIDDHDEP